MHTAGRAEGRHAARALVQPGSLFPRSVCLVSAHLPPYAVRVCQGCVSPAVQLVDPGHEGGSAPIPQDLNNCRLFTCMFSVPTTPY